MLATNSEYMLCLKYYKKKDVEYILYIVTQKEPRLYKTKSDTRAMRKEWVNLHITKKYQKKK
jgi:hypothetical protein